MEAQQPSNVPSDAEVVAISERLLSRSLGYTEVPPEAETSKAAETVVVFGNASPQMLVPLHDEQGVKVGDMRVPHPSLHQSATRVEMWPGFDDEEFVKLTLSTDNDRLMSMIGQLLPSELRKYTVGVAELDQIVDFHTAGGKPAWVVSNDPQFAKALGVHFKCPVGEPTMLLTNGGRDALHAQHMTTGAQPAAFNYIALTASGVAPAATDTTLAGEITTGGGGLIRAQATYAHTVGTNTTTLTKTFTANGSDTLPVTLTQIGVFNASSSGTLGYHTAMNASATLSVSGDNLTLTETVTAG